jgi:serine/threonine protein phosphatase PrpC
MLADPAAILPTMVRSEPPPSAARAVALLGRDYPRLGTLGAVALPDGGALAISRGQEPKPYRHVDPNEDAALIVRDGAGVLLAVADGHNGLAASELVTEAVRRGARDLLSPDPSRFAAQLEELLLALRQELRAVGPSRTCLLVASLVADRCLFACFGDSALYRAGQPDPVTAPNPCVLGPTLVFDDAIRSAALGSFVRKPGERVALVTDGVLDFVQAPDSVPGLLASADDDAECARAIARAAMRGGAGDNIAVALYSGPV